ncbi:zf-TFIIB domain-containing protein [Luteimonas marina]|nr:zf-TFIIB domain-containing protein [Luteimonas marina]
MPACPVDRSTMQAIALPGGQAEHQCPRCAGLWMPGALVRASLGEIPRQRLQAAGSARRLRCPDDDGALVAIMHRGVEIDVCPRCSGVWLDAGERMRMLEASRPPARRQAGATDISGAIELIDLGAGLLDGAGDVAGKLLEFVGEALSSL